jgi:putative DNA primase/helicase
LLGDYATQTDPSVLLLKRFDAIPNDVARLHGARFVAAVEVEEGRRLAESLVKAMTGGEPLVARFLRQEFFEFKPTFKLWLGTNHKPQIRGTDWVIWRRIRLIPFDVVIPPEEQDKKLLLKLRAELSGILAWAVEGCLEWQRGSLGEPEEVKSATEGYRAEMDVLAGFLSDCCVVRDDAKASAKDLYRAYGEWCETNGEKAENQRRFGERLTERGFERYKVKGVSWWRGIRLAAQVDEVDEGRPKSGINETTQISYSAMPTKGLPSSTSSTQTGL